jgi:hypothetical protein
VSVAGWRRRRLDVCAAGTLGVALCAAVAADARSTPVSDVATTYYTLRWTSPAGMAIWLLLGWSLASLLGPGLARRVRPAPAWWPAAALAVAGAVGLVSAAAAAPAPQPFHQMRTVAARATATTPSSGIVRVDRSASFGAFTAAVDFQAGLAYALRRDGRSVQVPDLAEKIGGQYGSGPFDHLLRVDVDDRVPRGGRPVARIDARTGDDAPPLPVTVTLWPGPSAR